MTAPRWIAEAIEAAYDNGPGDGKLATALIERLPMEAMVAAIAILPSTREACVGLVAKIVGVLTDGDPEVVELAELYQGACRALDVAGVPYAVDVDPEHLAIEAVVGEMSLRKPVDVHMVPAHPGTVPLDLAGRIRWLAQQRPIRAELESAQATRDLAEKMATKYQAERDAAQQRANTLRIEREHFEQMAADLQASLNDMNATAERLQGERDLAREMHQNAECAFADAVGELGAARAKVADQAAYIEALELELDALEDEIYKDEP